MTEKTGVVPYRAMSMPVAVCAPAPEAPATAATELDGAPGFPATGESERLPPGNGDGAPAVKRFLKDMDGMVPWTWWNQEEVGHSQDGLKELMKLFIKLKQMVEIEL